MRCKGYLWSLKDFKFKAPCVTTSQKSFIQISVFEQFEDKNQCSDTNKSILMKFFHLILKRFSQFGVLKPIQYNLPKVSGAVGAMWLHFIVCSKISKRSSKVDTLKMSFTFCPAVPSILTSKIKTKSIKVLTETENYISLTSFLNVCKTFQ